MEDECIIGQKITKIRSMTTQELNSEGWENGTAIELENGTVIYPSSDEEGNDSGELFGVSKGNQFVIFPNKEE